MTQADPVSSWQAMLNRFPPRADRERRVHCRRCGKPRGRHRFPTDECPGSDWGSLLSVFEDPREAER